FHLDRSGAAAIRQGETRTSELVLHGCNQNERLLYLVRLAAQAFLETQDLERHTRLIAEALVIAQIVVAGVRKAQTQRRRTQNQIAFLVEVLIADGADIDRRRSAKTKCRAVGCWHSAGQKRE